MCTVSLSLFAGRRESSEASKQSLREPCKSTTRTSEPCSPTRAKSQSSYRFQTVHIVSFVNYGNKAPTGLCSKSSEASTHSLREQHKSTPESVNHAVQYLRRLSQDPPSQSNFTFHGVHLYHVPIVNFSK